MADQGERVIHDAARRYPIEHLPVIEGIECGVVTPCNASRPRQVVHNARKVCRALAGLT